MEYLEANKQAIIDLVKDNITHKQIAEYLKDAFPEVKRGFSERNVRLFCKNNNIKKMNEQEVDQIVRKCVDEVGPTYGRKMMFGYIGSKGHPLTKHQTRESLKRVHPDNNENHCSDSIRRSSPVPYNVLYHGQKLHCDQNEKLQRYGCTFIAFSDGYSRRIVSFFLMPKKNAVIAYSHFRDLLLQEGMWDMIRVDHGTEYALMLFIQSMLKDCRRNQHCEPYMQTQSRQNLRAERKWPELNQRVLYPIKEVLISMETRLILNMYDPIVQFSVSSVTMNVAEIGAQRVVAARNAHPIEGSNQQIPDVMAINNSQVKMINPSMVPTVEEAITLYENAGGKLTRGCCFGIDPLMGNDEQIRRRENRFKSANPSYNVVFDHLNAGDGSLFENAILSFINITYDIAQQL